MAGLGLLFAGLSGAGKALSSSYAQDEEAQRQQQLMQERSRLEEERTLRIEEAKRVAQRQANIQQGQQISAATSDLQNSRDAAAINAANGSNMTADDAAILRNNPEARKAYGLLGSTRQSDLEDRATAAEKLGDLNAAKEIRGQLQTEVQNQRYERNDETMNRRLDNQEAHQSQIEKYQQRREDRLDRLASAQLAFQQSRANKEDARSDQAATNAQRAATASALKGVQDDIKSIEKDNVNPMLAPEVKTYNDNQLKQLRSEAARYRSALAGAGLDGSKAPDKPFNPDDFRLPSAKSKSGGMVPNPMAQDSQSAPQKIAPKEQAKSDLDKAINTTVRQLTDASNRGDKTEAGRLNSLLQEQQAAKRKLYD
jgi:hypothetical protein